MRSRMELKTSEHHGGKISLYILYLVIRLYAKDDIYHVLSPPKHKAIYWPQATIFPTTKNSCMIAKNSCNICYGLIEEKF